MAPPTTLVRRALIVVHRWLGVALSLLFLLWFLSGIVMMYWTFPQVTDADRLARAPVLDASRVTLTAEEAFAAAGREDPPADVRLATFDGRPVYRAAGLGSPSMVYADDGTVPVVNEATVDRAASAWAGLPLTGADKVPAVEIDQWTVGSDLSAIRPLFKYTFPDGQQVYVDGNTAEVVQYTTTASRMWAYLGAIPHWLYFTPLRKHGREWFSVVVWSSLVGTMAVLAGLVIAVWMYSPRRRYRFAGAPTSIPYRGWKRLHTIAGLVFGVTTLTWTFSGLLSMGPFPATEWLAEVTVPTAASRGSAGESGSGPRDPLERWELEAALRGDALDVRAYAGKHPATAIASIADFLPKEIELTQFNGDAAYLVRNAHGETRVVPVHGEPALAYDLHAVMQVVRDASGNRLAELRVMDQYDAYYRDRHRERPLPVIYARMNDAAGSRFYIDPGTAAVVEAYDARNWVSRWLYRGLHSLDFPWLYNARPLWDIVVVTLMLGGAALCVTSIVMTWRVLTRTIAGFFRARIAPPDEDLAA